MRPFANWKRTWAAIDWLGNHTAIPTRFIVPLVSLTWGAGTLTKPNLKNVQIGLGKQRTQSLFYNGILFVRVMLPFFIGVQIRWSGSTTKLALLQMDAGWKLNGRFGLAFRIQSDQSARAGMDIANPWEAQGWAQGGH